VKNSNQHHKIHIPDLQYTGKVELLINPVDFFNEFKGLPMMAKSQ
jgi:hypothetical protein